MAVLKVVLKDVGNPDNLEMKVEQYISTYTHLIYLTGGTCSLISNGGGPCATDWTNPTGGIAQDWAWYSEPL